MGEVYQARDTSLGRDVAVKILLSAFSADEDRLRRFKQEANATGMLNHPNILAIYDIGSHDGVPYVVSELLEGMTLRDRMNGSTLSPRKVTDYAVQIASGLAAAHEKGIVHRDLKPENIFITKDGRAKILDFGLAKLTILAGRPETDASTLPDLTEPGRVLGTVGYMSPEQVRGLEVDHRSDIFAFGAILYEMLSGKRAFQGNSAVETLHAILKEDPPDLPHTNPYVSPALERVMRHCLEKDPEERFQSARDLAFDLGMISGISLPDSPPTIIKPTPLRRYLWPTVIAFALLLAAAGGYFYSQFARQTTLPSYYQITFRRGTIFSARFAPDKRTIVYSATWNGNPLDLFSTLSGSPESRSLGMTDADILAISSSGEMAILINRRYIGHFISRGTLAHLPLGGSAPREILEDVQQADWSPDGTSLVVVRYVDGRNRLEYPIGKVLYETSGHISYPRFSPKGDMIAFLDHPGPLDNRGWVAVIDLNGNKRTLSGEWAVEEGLAWSPAGNEVWFTASKAGEVTALHAVSVAGKERVVARVPINMMLHDISPGGDVLLTVYNLSTPIVGLPPGEAKERDLSWLDNASLYDLSADGKTFIFQYYGQGSGVNYASYLRRTDGSPAVRLGEGAALALSPDGKWVLAVLNVPRQAILMPTGAGEIRRLERDGLEDHGNNSWFPDGKHVIFTGKEPGKGARCYMQDIDGGEPRPITPEGVTGTMVSPDGKFLVATDAQQKKYLYPLDGGESRPLNGLDANDKIVRWSGDGRSLFVYRRGELPVKIYRLGLGNGNKELLRELMPSDASGIYVTPRLFLTPDGKSYVYQLQRYLSDLYRVEGLF